MVAGLTAAFLSGAGAGSAAADSVNGQGDGENDLNIINIAVDGEPIVDLDILFQQTAIAPTGAAFSDPIDPDFTGDLDAILAADSLTRFDVHDVMFMRLELEPLIDVDTEVSLWMSDDAQFIGDAENDPLNIIILQGEIDITVTNTTTTTPRFDDTLTIKLFDEVPAPPPSGGGTVVPTPAAAAAGLALLGVLALRRRRRAV